MPYYAELTRKYYENYKELLDSSKLRKYGEYEKSHQNYY